MATQKNKEIPQVPWPIMTAEKKRISFLLESDQR
jgi:hypothetical protein